jgi:hypothetical protein
MSDVMLSAADISTTVVNLTYPDVSYALMLC